MKSKGESKKEGENQTHMLLLSVAFCVVGHAGALFSAFVSVSHRAKWAELLLEP
jgi:hypothetical protein